MFPNVGSGFRPGIVNGPAGTTTAEVIVVSGRLSFARSSQAIGLAAAVWVVSVDA